MEEREESVRTIFGGDFDARTGEEGGRMEEVGKEEEKRRRSKDKKVNKEGRRLVKVIRERG